MALSYPLCSATGWSNLELAGGIRVQMEIVVVCCVFFFNLIFLLPPFSWKILFFFFLGGGGWRARWCNSPLPGPNLEFFTHL